MIEDHEGTFHQHDEFAHIPSDPALRAKTLESLLVEKGLLNPATVDAVIEQFEKEVEKEKERIRAGKWYHNLLPFTIEIKRKTR